MSGSFLHDKEFHLAARSLKNKVGIQVVTPLRTDDGKIVLFDRGWVPSDRKEPAKRAEGQVAGKVELTGIVRRSQVQRQFAPDNVPDKNVWFHVDVPADAQDGGRGARSGARHVLPRSRRHSPIRAACRSAARRGSTSPTTICSTRITWFGIALAVAGVYLAYHWENGRLTVNGRTKRTA